MLSGWSTHGILLCPYCMEHTKSFRLVHARKPCFYIFTFITNFYEVIFRLKVKNIILKRKLSMTIQFLDYQVKKY